MTAITAFSESRASPDRFRPPPSYHGRQGSRSDAAGGVSRVCVRVCVCARVPGCALSFVFPCLSCVCVLALAYSSL